MNPFKIHLMVINPYSASVYVQKKKNKVDVLKTELALVESATLILFQDNDTEYKVPKEISNKISHIFYIIIRPDLEMLHIHAIGRYQDFSRSNMKPLDYFKQKYPGCDVKSKEFIQDLYQKKSIVDAALGHRRNQKLRLSGDKNNCYLADLIDENKIRGRT